MKDKFPKNSQALLMYALFSIVVILLLNVLVFPLLTSENYIDTAYSTFLDMIESGRVQEVAMRDSDIYYTTANGNDQIMYYKTGEWPDGNLLERLRGADIPFGAQIEGDTSPITVFLISWFFPVVLAILIGRLIFSKRMGGMGTFGKSTAKIYVQAQTGVTFANVAGQNEAKEALEEIVDFLHNPEKYSAIGAKLPKGALLVGPPGTGKTLMAKAVAGEADVPFFSITGSEFVEMFVGMGAAKVRDLFKQANEKAPCIVFIDEIDAIGKKRDGAASMGGNDEREQTLNQLLAEMDGFDGQKAVVILGATNRPETLDKALLRPGRFDRRIPVELPDLRGREAILKVHAQGIKAEPDVNYRAIARSTPGASGAELANIINEAALLAVRTGRDVITQSDLEESVEVILAGYQRKGAVLSPHEKRVIAYHEIGHALVSANLKDGSPVHKITIIPRTSGALGFTMHVDEEEHFLMSRDQLVARITSITGGRAAEEIVSSNVTSGASDDIEKATKIARAMISRYGMSDQFGMVALESVTNQYLGGDTALACSPDTSTRVDQEVIALISQCHAKALDILRSHEDQLHLLAQRLYDQETITGEEFAALLRGEPLPPTAEAL